ncbi:MAG: thiamine pyrophosphate-dependent enzyme [Myxococcales bacterium]|nr:thiamine pyrophosphate-dependent enzyme [Myxococcales bacterium]
MYGLKTDWPEEAPPSYFTLDDYAGQVPRWCPGCGDHAVLTAVQRLCRDEQLEPEKSVFVSGIGCSSRLPHYMKAYGFHGLHGRAFPVASGIRARRPDLNIFVSTGDGDCCAIGAGHWVHAIHNNMKMVVLLFDNNVYGLTKNQTSPTSRRGQKTNTHPRGAWLDPIDPIQTTLGITNVSFVAQTVDWNPPHLLATVKAAHHHPGLAFVRVVQRCPHFPTEAVERLRSDPTQLLLLDHPDGIEVDEAVKKAFKRREAHDPADLDAARVLAGRADGLPVGLLYRNESADRYDLYSVDGLATPRKEKIEALREELNRYRI